MKAGGGPTKYQLLLEIMAQINLDLHHFPWTIVVFCLLFLNFAGQGGAKVSERFFRKSRCLFSNVDPFN